MMVVVDYRTENESEGQEGGMLSQHPKRVVTCAVVCFRKFKWNHSSGQEYCNQILQSEATIK